MFRPRQSSVLLHLVTGCLLSLWLFFGCLELVEQLATVSEATETGQAEQDPDQEALAQLASGLKPDSPSLAVPCIAPVPLVVAPSLLPSVSPGHSNTWLMAHGPPALRLHQQLSVYRI